MSMYLVVGVLRCLVRLCQQLKTTERSSQAPSVEFNKNNRYLCVCVGLLLTKRRNINNNPPYDKGPYKEDGDTYDKIKSG